VLSENKDRGDAMYNDRTPFGVEQDRIYMREALAQARVAFSQDEVPIGAVMVDAEGHILSAAYNKTEQECSQRAHAEGFVIEAVGKQRNDWRLDGCWLYVTLEPCIMCMGLILLSRCEGIVFGADSPLFGSRLDNYELSPVYKKDALQVVRGVCAEEAADMLRQFFQKKRVGL
jgi:tRNA(adenine34) deaminase